jgi:hypothetical protein
MELAVRPLFIIDLASRDLRRRRGSALDSEGHGSGHRYILPSLCLEREHNTSIKIEYFNIVYMLYAANAVGHYIIIIEIIIEGNVWLTR